MEDFIIIGIITVILIGVIVYVVRNRNKRSCCDSGTLKLKKKKLSNVLYQRTFKVEGMHCDNCKTRVEEVVNDIAGVAGSVDLKKETLTVSYAEDVDDELIKARIERAGYTVVGTV